MNANSDKRHEASKEIMKATSFLHELFPHYQSGILYHSNKDSSNIMGFINKEDDKKIIPLYHKNYNINNIKDHLNELKYSNVDVAPILVCSEPLENIDRGEYEVFDKNFLFLSNYFNKQIMQNTKSIQTYVFGEHKGKKGLYGADIEFSEGFMQSFPIYELGKPLTVKNNRLINDSDQGQFNF